MYSCTCDMYQGPPYPLNVCTRYAFSRPSLVLNVFGERVVCLQSSFGNVEGIWGTSGRWPFRFFSVFIRFLKMEEQNTPVLCEVYFMPNQCNDN